MQIIQFYNNDRAPSLKDRKKLKVFLAKLFKRERQTLHRLTYIFCSDQYLLKINNEFLKHDFFTDIITFDLGRDKQQTIGEVYISIDRVKENAKKLNIPFNSEIHRVIIHGALHLCGYKDKKTSEIAEMRNREDYYLLKYLNPNSNI